MTGRKFFSQSKMNNFRFVMAWYVTLLYFHDVKVCSYWKCRNTLTMGPCCTNFTSWVTKFSMPSRNPCRTPGSCCLLQRKMDSSQSHLIGKVILFLFPLLRIWLILISLCTAWNLSPRIRTFAQRPMNNLFMWV